MASAPITDYASLQDTIVRYIDDADIANEAASCIVQAEAEFRRLIVTPDMSTDVSAPITIADASIALPVDYDSVLMLTVLGDVQSTVTPYPQDDFANLNPNVKGQPRYYVADGVNLSLWPTPDASYSAILKYRATLPALSNTNPTNWLIRKHPDAYLMGALLQAEFFGWNDDRLPIIKARLEEITDQINTAGNRARYGGGPIQMRPPVQENLARSQGRGYLRW